LAALALILLTSYPIEDDSWSVTKYVVVPVLAKELTHLLGKTFLGENYCVRGGGVIEIAGYIGIFAALAFKDITEAQDSIGLVRCGIVQTIGFLAGRILNTAVNIIKN